jgi:hypothetical protein
MLTIAEEILLLLLKDESGEFLPVQTWSKQCALAGAALMDLALQNRIDTDIHKLVVVDRSSTGHDFLDPILERISAEPEVRDARQWVVRVAEKQSDGIQDQVLSRLAERGIIEAQRNDRRDTHYWWTFRPHRYPTIDGTVEREVKRRITQVIFSDDIPSPQDIMIISLVDACGILNEILANRQVEKERERLDMLRRLELIGQATSNAIRHIERSVAYAVNFKDFNTHEGRSG